MTLSKSRTNRAGLHLAEWWLDRRQLEPDVFATELAVVGEWRQQHAYPLSLTTPGLRNWVGRETDVRPIPVAQRLKQMVTIVQKLARHQDPRMKLARMQDIAGCRGLLPTNAAIDRVAAKVHSNWRVVDTDDYRERGKPATGYRALHIIVSKRDRLVEIQLRTHRQHRWAETVAATGERLGYALKDGSGPSDLLEYFRLASELFWLQERGLPVPAPTTRQFVRLREAVRPYFAERA